MLDDEVRTLQAVELGFEARVVHRILLVDSIFAFLSSIAAGLLHVKLSQSSLSLVQGQGFVLADLLELSPLLLPRVVFTEVVLR